MKVIVVHDSAGGIVAVARVEDKLKGGTVRGRRPKFGAGLLPEPGQSVLELEVPADMAKKSVSEIHNEYSVDLKTKRLVRRTAG